MTIEVDGFEPTDARARHFLESAAKALLIGGKWQPAASGETFPSARWSTTPGRTGLSASCAAASSASASFSSVISRPEQ